MQPGEEEAETSDQVDSMSNQQQQPMSAPSSAATNASNNVYVWSWKETDFQMVHHPPGSIVGDPSDCWIRYGRISNKKLETAYEREDDTCDLDQRYAVDFTNMNQINKVTGFTRKVQRTIDVPKVWCWKEIPGLMWKHSPSTIYGNHSDCWIKFSSAESDQLERCYLEGEEEEISIRNGIVVNFDEMCETNEATGVEREVQRFDAKEENEAEDSDNEEQVVPDRAASSSNAAVAATAPVQKVWCWKETDGFQWNHHPSTIYGDPANCWIKYDQAASQILEDGFQTQPFGIVSPKQGYNVNLAIMKQVNIVTGFERDVQRVDPIEEEQEEEEEEALTTAQAQEMITNLQNESEKMKEKQDEMDKELKTVRNELKETQYELKQTTQERNDLKNQVDGMKETLDALQKSVDMLLAQSQSTTSVQEKETADSNPSTSVAKKRVHADLDAPEDEEQERKKQAN